MVRTSRVFFFRDEVFQTESVRLAFQGFIKVIDKTWLFFLLNDESDLRWFAYMIRVEFIPLEIISAKHFFSIT